MPINLAIPIVMEGTLLHLEAITPHKDTHRLRATRHQQQGTLPASIHQQVTPLKAIHRQGILQLGILPMVDTLPKVDTHLRVLILLQLAMFLIMDTILEQR